MGDEARRDVRDRPGPARAGAGEALTGLIPVVYDELRQIAAGLMRQERAGHTLQPTALVNEALVRLLGADVAALAGEPRVFFGAAVRAMRQVLVDHARRRAADKRADGKGRSPLDEAAARVEGPRLDVLALHEALAELAGLHARQAQVVELRFFGGFTVPEVAAVLGVSVSLVESDYRKACAYLRLRLDGEGAPP